MTTQTKPARPRKKNGFFREIAANKWLYGMVTPGLICFAIFSYLPLAGLYFAFVNYNFMKGPFGFGSEFVGLANFEFFFTSDQWLPITINTLYLNFAFLLTGLFAQILLALFGAEGGFVNRVLMRLGFEEIYFYQTPEIWPAMLIGFRLWKGTGFGTVIFLATITGINQEIFEAARIDGANRIKTAWCNTLLRETTDVIDTYVYRALRVNNDIGMSSAVGLFQSAIGLIMVVTVNAIARKVDKETALF